MTKVAIVEDDIAIVQMYLMKFQTEGFEVVTANDGKAGLELAEKEDPDIILLDLMMPQMRGDEMLVEMRKKPWGKEVKVIILTNMGESEAPAEVKANNVLDFIVKADMTPKQVVEKVKEHLAK